VKPGTVAAIFLYGIALYNNLVNLRNRVKNGFSQIDVQLTRRHDLIPNLVEAVKGYIAHTRETLKEVIEARNAAVSGLQNATADPADPEAIKQLGAAEGALRWIESASARSPVAQRCTVRREELKRKIDTW